MPYAQGVADAAQAQPQVMQQIAAQEVEKKQREENEQVQKSEKSDPARKVKDREEGDPPRYPGRQPRKHKRRKKDLALSAPEEETQASSHSPFSGRLFDLKV